MPFAACSHDELSSGRAQALQTLFRRVIYNLLQLAYTKNYLAKRPSLSR